MSDFRIQSLNFNDPTSTKCQNEFYFQVKHLYTIFVQDSDTWFVLGAFLKKNATVNSQQEGLWFKSPLDPGPSVWVLSSSLGFKDPKRFILMVL